MPPDRKPPETLDEKVTSATETTRYAKPHRDHGIESPMIRPPSVSQLAAQAPSGSSESIEGGVHGQLVQVAFEDGEFVLRLARATASMKTLAQFFAAQGLDVEIVLRRRMP